MTDQAEFDDFATLWQNEPGAAEQQMLERIAQKVGRRARIVQRIEVGSGLLLLALLAIGLFLAPLPAALFAGAVFAGALIWTTWKRHHLHQIALLVDTSSRETLIDSLIRGAEVRVRRSRLNLCLLLPGYGLGAMAQYAILNGSLSGFPAALARQTLPVSSNGLTAVLLLSAAFAWFLRSHMRIGRELTSFRKLKQEYRAEARLDART